jgi:hypothetical protein
MNIAEKKAQILKLIEKLNPESPQSAPRQTKESAILKHPLSDRLARRRQELAELKERREKTGLDLLEARMLRTCQMLEERIARIERIIGVGDRQKDARLAPDAPYGTELAPESTTMQPSVQTAAKSQPGRPVALPAPTAGKERTYTLSGVIQEGVLADILQLLSSNKKTGAFTADADGKKVEMYFRDGNLYHATCEDISGQSAFFVGMALENGTFCFEETDQLPDEVSIDGNTQFMILEALRQIDEEHAKK